MSLAPSPQGRCRKLFKGFSRLTIKYVLASRTREPHQELPAEASHAVRADPSLLRVRLHECARLERRRRGPVLW